MSAKTILIQSESIGHGEGQLGKMLMANFLRLLGESETRPGTILFWHTGVRLLTADSPVLNHLKRLEEQGVELLACTTCLEYFDLKDKMAVGKPTTMGKSIQSMFTTDMVTI
jgi:selenium metabolism protein YedF